MSVAEYISWAPGAVGRWVKSLFTRDALADGAKTAVWVIPLTILVWIYAEQQQRTNENEQTVLVHVRSTDPDRVVSIQHAGDDVPMIAMSGPRAGIDTVKDALNKQGDNRLIMIDVPPTAGLGNNVQVDLAQQIAQASIFRKNGIEVSNVRPPRITVKVEVLETRDVEVQPDTPERLDGQATFEPKTVKVRAPSSVFASGKAPVAYAKIPTAGDLAKPGIHPDIPLPIELPFQSDNVSLLSGTTVQATYGIKASNVSEEIPSLLIKTLFVGKMANDAIVEMDSPIIKVSVIGPKDQVESVKEHSNSNDPPVPYAILSIDPSDVPSAPGASKQVTKTLDFNFIKPDVIADPKDPKSKYTITVTVRHRPSGQ